MKSRHLALLSLLALSCAASGQSAIPQFNPQADEGNGVFTFARSGMPYHLELCSTEICTTDKSGRLKIEPITGGSTAVMQRANADGYLVFYQPGKEGDERARRILRNSYLVELPVGSDPKEFQERHGINEIKMLYPEKGLAVCIETSAAKVLTQVEAVSKDPLVKAVEPLFARQQFSRRAEVPTDPYYTSPGVDGNYQWYLNNDGSNGGVADVDINVEGAWCVTDTTGNFIDGTGVNIAIVDDGVFTGHPDLANLDLDLSFNFNGTDTADINPQNIDEDHGTSVASLVASPRDNGEGMSGAAPGSTPFGLRLIAEPTTDAQEAEALGYMINQTWVSNNSWGPSDFETTLEPIGPLARAAIENAAAMGRVLNAGTVFVWAGGNGAEFNDNSNYDGYANLPETIAVGAVTDQGVRASYSERGANLVVTAPSDGGIQAITAASIDTELDDAGNPTGPILPSYSTEFGGTSAATPLVSGVVGLMIDSNPILPWRDIQEILMQTATRVDSTNADWFQNAAGFWFNHEYGAGLVNAEAAVMAAQSRTLPNFLPERGDPLTLNQTPLEAIPDGTGESFIMSFDLSDEPNRRVEHVQLRTTILSTRRADLEIVLISPSGTQSILAETHENSNEQSISDWTFMTVRNWGEGSAGTWVLRVTDRNEGNLATMNNAQIIIHGPEDAVAPVVSSPILVSNRSIAGLEGTPLSYLVETLGAQNITVGALPAGLVYDPGTRIISGVPENAGFSNTLLTLSGANGTSEISLSFVIEEIATSLGSVIGVPLLESTSSGDLPWEIEFDQVLTGLTSAGSPQDLEDNQESSFGFEGLPSGVALFSWRVSSESSPFAGVTGSYDRLWVQVGGGNVPQAWSSFIDGSKDWDQVAVRLPETSNSIEWTYSKNVSESVSEDRGYVDGLEFREYDTYLKDIGDAANINFDFEIESRTLWMPIVDATAPDGESIRASAIGNGQTVSMSTWVDGPSRISFDYRTSTDDGDVLEVLVNGVLYNEFLTVSVGGVDLIEDGSPVTLIGSGIQTQWQTATGDISEGRNLVEIRYRKDFTGESSEDTIWLDNVSIIGANTAAAWAASIGVNLNEDTDKDGFTNREEYAFGGNPLVADVPAYIPTYQTDGINRWFEYGIDSAITDLSFVAEESTDLDNWVEMDSPPVSRTEGSVNYYRIPILSQEGFPEKFYRLMAVDAQ